MTRQITIGDRIYTMPFQKAPSREELVVEIVRQEDQISALKARVEELEGAIKAHKKETEFLHQITNGYRSRERHDMILYRMLKPGVNRGE